MVVGAAFSDELLVVRDGGIGRERLLNLTGDVLERLPGIVHGELGN
ncbi:MAG TPA: hypothetical protein VGO08_03960 [Burkholderiales bacterium]|nr:hypothetical protein [Burkholderiales bacterium]